jgi:hypothetical protein
MRVIGFLPCHYGKEYLKECLISIINHCEKVVVAYTAFPSHGFGTGEKCPDTREEILSICQSVLGDKLIWDESVYSQENQHRRQVHNYSPGFDLVLSIDADEVFEPKELTGALEYSYNNKERYFGIKGYVNFWRSFNYACYDGFRPIRIENLNNHNVQQNHECPLTIYHFSTAQSEPVMRYKYKIFGHASEIRENWLDGTYYSTICAQDQKDVHCVSIGLWNPVQFDKETLPAFLKEHANFNKEVI